MNKITKLNPLKCPMAIAHIVSLPSEKGFSVFKGQAYEVENIQGKQTVWHIGYGSAFENNWSDADFGFVPNSTQQTAKHTQLPFAIGGIDSSEVTAFNGDALIADCSMGNGTKAERQANAKFIVRACNSHYELVNANKDALSFFDSPAWKQFANEYASHEKLGFLIAAAWLREQQLKSALTSAQGKEN